MKTIVFAIVMCCGCCAANAGDWYALPGSEPFRLDANAQRAIDPFGRSDCANGKCPVATAVAKAPAAIARSAVNVTQRVIQTPAKMVNSLRSSDCGCQGNCGFTGCRCAPVASSWRGAAIQPIRSRLFHARRWNR